MSDETILDHNAVNETKKKNDNNKKDPKNKKRIGTAGVAAISGVAGMAVGIMTPVEVFPENLDGDVETTDTNEEITVAPEPSNEITGHDLDIATSVDDSMSFNEAFAAARHEVGPGGIFMWHGHSYNTYYAEEWNSMSPEEHEQYWADVYHTINNNATNTDPGLEPLDPEDPGLEPIDPEDPVLEPVDEENIVVEEPQEYLLDEQPIDETNIIVETDEIPIDDSLDVDNNAIDGTADDPIENLDIDEFAINDFDTDLNIDNQMDMSDFV